MKPFSTENLRVVIADHCQTIRQQIADTAVIKSNVLCVKALVDIIEK